MNKDKLKEKAEKMYRKKNYSCEGYMCVVGTTCYNAKERKQICIKCLMQRLLEKEGNN